ncbi:globin family protein [Iningainema tapete]|uniref:Flavohemoprotein n=1 Tax=Iningainema tapete BLCC-T55 TaxID=2748662 RepID=A0A8J6XP81_9CYAN|nr:globin family protein [Iningainema tapete]MBD2775549.1 flavohemoprotein [Iningainema tapete BLCC-T55]
MSLNVEVLEQSFAQIKPHSTEFAASFYDNLFADYPDVQPLFAHTNMVEQRKHLLSALVLVVENLRKSDVLNQALRGLGARHLEYSVLPEHYPMIGATLLKTFEYYLGDDWNPEVKQAWTDAYSEIAQVMQQGL